MQITSQEYKKFRKTSQLYKEIGPKYEVESSMGYLLNGNNMRKF